VIHGPSSADYDVDLGPVILTDWYHDEYESIVTKVLSDSGGTSTGSRPYSDATLINGKGIYPCENVTSSTSCDNIGGPQDGTNGSCTDAPSCSLASLSQFRFTSGKKHLLRLVNTGAELFTLFSIDNHTLTVIANDFTPIEPYTTDFVTLSVGQRTDVIVEANGDPSEAYWMRSTANQICSDSNNPDGRAIIYYEKADTWALPWTTGYPLPQSPDSNGCTNDDLTLTVPSCAMAVEDPGTTFTLSLNIGRNASGVTQWLMNGVAFQGDYSDATLLRVAQGNDSFESAWNVYNQGNSTSVRIIVYNQFLADHPMHLHGHAFHVLATGTGTWDGTIINPSNPQRRDVQQIAAGGTVDNPTYIVLQWDQDNPGVWPFHCHIAWHLSAGMYINILERPDDIPSLDIPQEYFDTCTAWNTWEQSHVIDQIDSGV
jgi:FtsP/CotA-like multicopper oxidase with cupredoxin domain